MIEVMKNITETYSPYKKQSHISSCNKLQKIKRSITENTLDPVAAYQPLHHPAHVTILTAYQPLLRIFCIVWHM
jgi:hypothetical protein